jgi:exonuclease III
MSLTFITSSNLLAITIDDAYPIPCFSFRHCLLPHNSAHGDNEKGVASYTVSATVSDIRTGSQWTITGVYGPQNDLDKRLFLQELCSLKSLAKPDWLILGDFNMIYLDHDKNHGRLNRRVMNHFHRTINHLEVREIQLLGRSFTWSNEQDVPTMTRIDRVFATIPWDDLHHAPILQTLSTAISDHCPLLLHSHSHLVGPPIFRFEAHWPLMPNFSECVQEAWN